MNTVQWCLFLFCCHQINFHLGLIIINILLCLEKWIHFQRVFGCQRSPNSTWSYRDKNYDEKLTHWEKWGGRGVSFNAWRLECYCMKCWNVSVFLYCRNRVSCLFGQFKKRHDCLAICICLPSAVPMFSIRAVRCVTVVQMQTLSRSRLLAALSLPCSAQMDIGVFGTGSLGLLRLTMRVQHKRLCCVTVLACLVKQRKTGVFMQVIAWSFICRIRHKRWFFSSLNPLSAKSATLPPPAPKAQCLSSANKQHWRAS